MQSLVKQCEFLELEFTRNFITINNNNQKMGRRGKRERKKIGEIEGKILKVSFEEMFKIVEQSLSEFRVGGSDPWCIFSHLTWSNPGESSVHLLTVLRFL